MENLLQHIKDRADYWIDLYNKSPTTDRGESTSDFAKGSYMAYLEIKSFIEHEQKEDYN
jgi:uncharacterized protein involved in high-affinity Fe2+ transport